jgi:hypothetical protein
VRRFFLVLVLAFALAAPGAAQVPEQPPASPTVEQQSQQELEEEFIHTRMANGQSHASGGRPELGPVVLGNPTTAVTALRVGLHATTFTPTGAVATEFASLHHLFVELTNTDGDVKVIDRATGKAITVMTPGSLVRVEHDGTGFLVTQDGLFSGSFAGPVFFRPTSRDNFFRVEHIRRVFSGTKVPLYRGAIEVGRGSTTAALPPPIRVNLVNIVEVERYVPGVVANESIASFATEALKAQAVAARGYAIANIGNYVRRGYPFDIVDSSASQSVSGRHLGARQRRARRIRDARAGRVIERSNHFRDVLLFVRRAQRAQRVDQLRVESHHGGHTAFVPSWHLRRPGAAAGLLDRGWHQRVLASSAA